MSALMLRSLMASAIATMAMVAVAQPSGQMPEVKVVADRPVVTHGPNAEGRPVEVIHLSHVVDYADLNIATQSGAIELRKRVSNAANLVCKEIDKLYGLKLYPTGRGDEGTKTCVADAVKGAEPQLQAAIAAAERGTRSAQAPK